MGLKEDITALRERTGAGFLECRKALHEFDNDIDKAARHLVEKGRAKADKRSSKVAAEGVILVVVSEDKKSAAIIEFNCETDFVARADDFTSFVNEVGKLALDNKITDVAVLMTTKLANEQTVEERRTELVARIGENIQVRRLELIESVNPIGGYCHGQRIGALVALDADQADLARDIAMHVAASKPLAISEEDLSPELVKQEHDIFVAQTKESGKPEAIIEKMVQGRIAKFKKENTLLGQSFVKNPDQTVADLLAEKQANVVAMVRFELGEGIEREVGDFSAEVMSEVEKSRKNKD